MCRCMKKVENHWYRGMRFASVTIARYSMHAPDIVCLLFSCKRSIRIRPIGNMPYFLAIV